MKSSQVEIECKVYRIASAVAIVQDRTQVNYNNIPEYIYICLFGYFSYVNTMSAFVDAHRDPFTNAASAVHLHEALSLFDGVA